MTNKRNNTEYVFQDRRKRHEGGKRRRGDPKGPDPMLIARLVILALFLIGLAVILKLRGVW